MSPVLVALGEDRGRDGRPSSGTISALGMEHGRPLVVDAGLRERAGHAEIIGIMIDIAAIVGLTETDPDGSLPGTTAG